MGKFTRIPAKWRDYICCGNVIPNERLISFKTPLSEEYHYNGNETDPDDCLQENEQFTPSNLCENVLKRKHLLGLVVDLTNTKRYYQAQEFENRKIEYKKIKCEGKVIPSEHVVHRFKATVLSFLAKCPNPEYIVGVHCTHGLNRAGYIVCRYLIECRGYSPQEAIEAFNHARGHEMERENYLDDLQQRKPKKLSNKDIDSLIKTSPASDDDCQTNTSVKRDDTDGYRYHGHRQRKFDPPKSEQHVSMTSQRGYKEKIKDRYVERPNYYYQSDVKQVNDREDDHGFTGDHWRYSSYNGRGQSKYDTNPRRDRREGRIDYGRHGHETDSRRGSRLQSHAMSETMFHRIKSRTEGYRRRQEEDYAGRYRYSPNIDVGPVSSDGYDRSYENSHYRERDDRNSRRMRKSRSSRDKR